MSPYVIRRPAQPRPAPESGVRLVAEERPRLRLVRGWVGLHDDVLGEFRRLGRVFNGDQMTNAKDEFRRCT